MHRLITTISMALLVIVLSIGARARIMGQESRARLTDDSIRACIEARLKTEGLSQVRVQVNDRVVTLSGTVHSLEEKRQAHGAAEDTSEVRQVDNHLTVEPAKLSDAELTNLAQQTLRRQGYMDYFSWVEATCTRGVVTLRGWVRDAALPPVYERFMEHIPGVQQVRDEIKTLPPAETNERWRVEIVRAIYHDPILRRYGNRIHPPIRVIVVGGKVILKGQVANAEERKRAARRAQEQCSCTPVNQLLVTTTNRRK